MATTTAHSGGLCPPTAMWPLGHVGSSGWEQPSQFAIWCLRKDLVSEARYPSESVWDDRGSGVTDGNVSLWDVHMAPTTPNMFPSQPTVS